MRKFIYTPIFTIPIDRIKTIKSRSSNRGVEIDCGDCAYYVKAEEYNPRKSTEEIYQDIQRQLAEAEK